MIRTYNRWGCTVTKIMDRLPNIATCSLGGNGDDTIEDYLDSAAREVSRSLREDMIAALTHVSHEILVEFATEGQSEATFEQTPLLANTIHLWKYDPTCDSGLFNENLDKWYNGCGDLTNGPPREGQCEMDDDDYSVVVSTGVVTFDPVLSKDQRVLASYDLDTEDSTFSVGSCCDAVLTLALADLTAILGDNSTVMHEHWRERAKELRRQMLKGDFIPAELRDRKFHREIVRNQSRISSRPLSRRG